MSKASGSVRLLRCSIWNMLWISNYLYEHTLTSKPTGNVSKGKLFRFANQSAGLVGIRGKEDCIHSRTDLEPNDNRVDIPLAYT